MRSGVVKDNSIYASIFSVRRGYAADSPSRDGIDHQHSTILSISIACPSDKRSLRFPVGGVLGMKIVWPDDDEYVRRYSW